MQPQTHTSTHPTHSPPPTHSTHTTHTVSFSLLPLSHTPAHTPKPPARRCNKPAQTLPDGRLPLLQRTREGILVRGKPVLAGSELLVERLHRGLHHISQFVLALHLARDALEPRARRGQAAEQQEHEEHEPRRCGPQLGSRASFGGRGAHPPGDAGHAPGMTQRPQHLTTQ